MLGKIIGGYLGFYMSDNFFGLILGIYLGHQFDLYRTNPITGGQRERARDSFFLTVFSLLGHIAKADGRISRDEIAQAETLMSKMGLHSNNRKRAIGLFKDGAQDDFSLDQTMQEFMRICGRYGYLKQQLLNYLISLALADGNFHFSEQKVLERVAYHLGFNAIQFNQFIEMIKAQSKFRGSSSGSEYAQPSKDEISDAYRALGVGADNSDSQIKRAYRKLISQNHPDKLIGQGMPKEMVNLATERTQEIQAAYELIVKGRNL
jgi:DnaJ like chaperone protein